MNWNLESQIREMIINCLVAHKGNRTKSAKALGISIRTLRNKIVEYRNVSELELEGFTENEANVLAAGGRVHVQSDAEHREECRVSLRKRKEMEALSSR